MSDSCQENRKTALLHDLAKLEHKQWRNWALTMLEFEEISSERKKRDEPIFAVLSLPSVLRNGGVEI